MIVNRIGDIMGAFVLLVFMSGLINLTVFCILFMSRISARGAFIFMSLLCLLETIAIYKMLPHL